MSSDFIRTYQKLDVKVIKPHLLIRGDLGCTCASCNSIDPELESTHCPECKTEFKYIAFRNIKTHFPKVHKLAEERPSIMIIDFDDYKKAEGRDKAKELFND